ncbi:MAG: hypothetical protein ACM30G_22990 [Micromonosporaceae bacterium]
MPRPSSAELESVRAGWRELVSSVTIVRVRRRRDLVAAWWHWRRVRRQLCELERAPILVRAAVDVPARTMTFVSVWPDVRSLLLFNGLGRHVTAVRWVIHGGHSTWTGVFRTAGPASLSQRQGEPNWLDVISADGRAAPARADGAVAAGGGG